MRSTSATVRPAGFSTSTCAPPARARQARSLSASWVAETITTSTPSASTASMSGTGRPPVASGELVGPVRIGIADGHDDVPAECRGPLAAHQPAADDAHAQAHAYS